MPHSTWDNYFSGDQATNWLGRNGFGATMACRRYWLPGGINLHRIKYPSENTKVERFFNPVVSNNNT